MVREDPGLYHEFECEIPDEEIEGVIKPQSHWNAPHKPVKLLGYELVEEKEVPVSSTEITFTGLDGDNDEEYLLEGVLVQPGGSGESSIKIAFNGITTDIGAARHYVGSAHSSEQLAYIPIANDIGGSGATNRLKFNIFTKTGMYRHVNGRFDNYKTNGGFNRFMVDVTGWWQNSSTPITSLTIYTDLRTFSGTIRLWKKLPLNNE